VNVTTASVRVMKSFDYSHFEIALSASLNSGDDVSKTTDDLRKTAARLADKAVEQYKVAKENAELMLSDERERGRLFEMQRRIQEKSEGEHTPKEKAVLKAISDACHRSRLRYDYEDEWDEEEWERIDEPDDVGVVF